MLRESDRPTHTHAPRVEPQRMYVRTYVQYVLYCTVLTSGEAPEGPRAPSGAEVFAKYCFQSREDGILPSLASSRTRTQYSAINFPPAPLCSSPGRADMQSASSGAGPEKVRPRAMHFPCDPPPDPRPISSA